MKSASPSRSKAGLASLTTLAAGLSLIAPALAQSTWTGATDGNWNTAGNWSPAGAPAIATDVVIDSSAVNPTSIAATLNRNGTGATTITGSGSLTINGANGSHWNLQGAGVTTISGNGQVLLTGTGANDGNKDNRFQNRGAFNVTGGALTAETSYFIVGLGGTGAFSQSGGAVNVDHRRGFFTSDGATSLGSSYTLSGGTLTVDSQALYNAGDAVNRTLRSVWLGKAGATSGTPSDQVVAANATGDTFRVTAGTATFTRTLLTSTADVLISRNSSLIIEGGSTTFADYSEVRVGYGNGGSNASTGTSPTGGNQSNITVSGGSLEITGGAALVLGYADNGTLNLAGGITTLEGALQLGRSGGSAQGLVIQTAGTLFAQDVVWTAGSYTFSGGDLWLPGDRTSLLSQSWFLEAPGTTADFDGTNTHIYLVPEPTSLALAFSALGLSGRRRRR